MYDLDIKTHKLHNTIIGRFMALFVAGVVCLSQAIPVFADDTSKTTVTSSDISIVFRTDQTSYFSNTDYTDIKIPCYIRIDTIPYNERYLSGYVSATVSAFNYIDQNSNRWSISYFENILGDTSVVYNRTTGALTLTFDNHLVNRGISYFVGYMHVSSANYTNSTLTLTCSNNSQPATISNIRAFQTEFEFGYVNAMIYALNNSANVEEMLTILNSIDANMLPEILTLMRSNHTALYNLIQNVWTTDQAVLSVNRDIYNTVLSILAILEDQYASQASNVEYIKDHVQTELNNARQDMELTKPSQVANLADDYIDQIDTTYNYSVFSWLTAPTFILMMCIVAALAIISYMLYGGQ